MLKARTLNYYTLLLSLLLMICCSINAQKLYYAGVDKQMNAANITYIAGKQDNNIVVWMYKYAGKTLQLNIYDNNMELLKQVSLKLDSISYIRDIYFFKKASCYDVLLQYTSTKKSIVEEVFSFDKAKETITPVKILNQSPVFKGIRVKYSLDGKYTGVIKGFKTDRDSIFIQYTLYNNQYQSLYDLPFPLPQKHNFINFDDVLIDNAGNLFFHAERSDTGTLGQEITIYEVNLKKDSLLSGNISRTERFSNIHIQLNNVNGGLNISGIWTDDNRKAVVPASSSSKYLFTTDLKEDLSIQGNMTLFSIDRIIDSFLSPVFNIRSSDLVLAKDSGYIFYVSGLVDYRTKHADFNSLQLPPAGQNFYQNRTVTADLSGSVTYHPLPNGTPATNADNHAGGRPGSYTFTVGGRNYFLMLSVNNNRISYLSNFKDSTIGDSSPQYEFVANTGRNIHYIYCRTIKKGKQLLFDLVAERNGQTQLRPVVTNSKYTMFLSEGVQVSSTSVVFHYLYRGKLAFAKMDLE